MARRLVPAIGPSSSMSAATIDYGQLRVQVAEQDVSMDSDKTVPLDIKLEPVGETVPGPRGRIQIEVGRLHGATAAAVLLNGKKPLYFVGHVDEFNNNVKPLWYQELVVPPGTHQVTVTRDGKELWWGRCTVAADQRVIVDISSGKEKIKPWPRGSSCKTNCVLPGDLSVSAPRFAAGIANATVVVAPVSGSVSANPSKIDCNQNTQLAWNSKETVEADMSGMSPFRRRARKPFRLGKPPCISLQLQDQVA